MVHAAIAELSSRLNLVVKWNNWIKGVAGVVISRGFERGCQEPGSFFPLKIITFPLLEGGGPLPPTPQMYLHSNDVCWDLVDKTFEETHRVCLWLKD